MLKGYDSERRFIQRSSIGATAFALILATGVRANEPSAFIMECFEGSQSIFTSEVADIEAFDAASRGVTLLQALPIPEKNLTLYQFGPADVFCLVANE